MMRHNLTDDPRAKTNARQLSLIAAVLVALGTSAFSGCRREELPKPVKPSSANRTDPASTREYPLRGTVRDIKAESGQVVIRHEAIPGFMAAMTMPFSIEDRAVFDDLRVGDEVEGTLRVVAKGGEVQDYALVNLAVKKPALARGPSLTLSFAGGEPTLRTTPRLLEPGDPVPDFTMTTEDGKAVKLSDLRGDVVVLTFIYTRCPLPDFCPLMDRKFAELAAAIGTFPDRARHVRMVSLSFDPEHDTPEVLKRHARTQGATPPLWTFAVASHEELFKVAPGLGLTYGPTPTEIVHNLSTAVIDPRGNLAHLLVGSAAKSWKVADLLKIVYPLLPTK